MSVQVHRRTRKPFEPPPVDPFAPCVHGGTEPTGETRACKSCNGSVELKLLKCHIHGTCTPVTAIPGTACCAICRERTPAAAYPAPTVRHLLYHVAPFRGNGNWQRCVQQLLRRIELFNGHRVVAIATHPRRMDRPGEVRALFAGKVHEFIELPNDPDLREVATFEALFERVENVNPAHATLWCHAKGVTHPEGHPTHRWTQMLEETYLDYWPWVAELLTRHPVAGSFLKHGPCWMGASRSDWHYSGSWFWFRHDALFSRQWREIDRFWSGIEPYPSLHFSFRQAGKIFHQGTGESMQIYPDPQGRTGPVGHDYLDQVVQPELAAWRAQHAHQRREY